MGVTPATRALAVRIESLLCSSSRHLVSLIAGSEAIAVVFIFLVTPLEDFIILSRLTCELFARGTSRKLSRTSSSATFHKDCSHWN